MPWRTITALALMTSTVATAAVAPALVSGPSPFAGCPSAPAYEGAEVEPALAAHPKQAGRLIAVYQQDRYHGGGARGIVAATSTDGGQTWRKAALPVSACAGSAARQAPFASDPWIADSQTKRIIRLGGVSAWDFKIDAEFDDPLVVGSNRKISVDYVGEVEVDGRTLLKLVVVQNFTSSSFVFLDPATYMIVRRDIVRNQKGGNVVLRTEYADYRAVAGVLLPHRVVVSQGEKRIRETVIETIEPNPVLTADVFKGPADTKR